MLSNHQKVPDPTYGSTPGLYLSLVETKNSNCFAKIYKCGLQYSSILIFVTCAANAIWYVSKYNSWAIGPLDIIGGEIRGITSSGQTGLKFNPYDVPHNEWWYYHNNTWNFGESIL